MILNVTYVVLSSGFGFVINILKRSNKAEPYEIHLK